MTIPLRGGLYAVLTGVLLLYYYCTIAVLSTVKRL